MGRGRLGGWGRGCDDECGSWCRWRRQQGQGECGQQSSKSGQGEPRRQEKPWRKRRRPVDALGWRRQQQGSRGAEWKGQ